ncbi:MAG: hypothetical protein ABI614_23960, partial [Planctomycetota bacterium]
MKAKIDLDAALLDFKSAYEASPDSALDDLLLLLLDPIACDTRLTLLDEIEGGQERTPQNPATQQRWKEIVEAVATHGPVSALESGKVTVDELDAITWNATALREVHERLLEIPEIFIPTANETTIEAATAHDLSRLWRLGNVERLRLQLETCMPALLNCLDAPQTLAPQAVEYILSQPDDPPATSFRSFVAKALMQFLRQHTDAEPALADDDWRRALVQTAAATVLGSFRDPDAAKDHPVWVVEFCRGVNAERLSSTEDILAWEPTTPATIEDITTFRYSLYERICNVERELLSAW